MKKFLFIFISIIALCSCEKQIQQDCDSQQVNSFDEKLKELSTKQHQLLSLYMSKTRSGDPDEDYVGDDEENLDEVEEMAEQLGDLFVSFYKENKTIIQSSTPKEVLSEDEIDILVQDESEFNSYLNRNTSKACNDYVKKFLNGGTIDSEDFINNKSITPFEKTLLVHYENCCIINQLVTSQREERDDDDFDRSVKADLARCDLDLGEDMRDCGLQATGTYLVAMFTCSPAISGFAALVSYASCAGGAKKSYDRCRRNALRR
ncbi:MAG: hypothetical protein IKR18_07550 [Bacteroidaceae bacterium]|nr:hypothetical protein [Bacteroidaceae bacterium]